MEQTATQAAAVMYTRAAGSMTDGKQWLLMLCGALLSGLTARSAVHVTCKAHQSTGYASVSRAARPLQLPVRCLCSAADGQDDDLTVLLSVPRLLLTLGMDMCSAALCVVQSWPRHPDACQR